MIDKSFFVIIFTLIALFFTSCSEENDDSSIVLSKNSLELIAGDRDTITILSGDSKCMVTTDNQTVASASIEGNNIIITTSKMGNAIITVDNERNNYSIIKVSATGPRIGGWQEYFPIGVEFIFVETENEDVTKQIKSELMTEAEICVMAVEMNHMKFWAG